MTHHPLSPFRPNEPHELWFEYTCIYPFWEFFTQAPAVFEESFEKCQQIKNIILPNFYPLKEGLAFYFNILESPWHRHASSRGLLNLNLCFSQKILKGKECANGRQTGELRPKKSSSKNLTWSSSVLNAKKRIIGSLHMLCINTVLIAPYVE